MHPTLKSVFVTTTLLSSLVLLGSGCSKKAVVSPEDDSTVGGGSDITYPSEDSSYSESGLAAEESMDSSESGAIGNLSVNNPGAEQTEEYKRLHGRSSAAFSPIYFEFDQANISGAMGPVLTANADYMKDNPSIVIVIEGNCDERGTNEYNLALGERRAINAKEYMVNLGINPVRIRTVSYGEERPLFSGQFEEDWAMNRRADFIIE